MRNFHVIIAGLLLSLTTTAQDSTFHQLIRSNLTTFSAGKDSFSGPGWDVLTAASQQTPYVLIGEDHFTNEIPAFTAALARATPFQNYFLELDPLSTGMIMQKMTTLSAAQLDAFVLNYQTTFSFLCFRPEFELIQELLRSGVHVRGTEQIFLLGDRLLAEAFKHSTPSARAKEIYQKIELRSHEQYRQFLKDQKATFYFLTEEFEKDLQQLRVLPLSPTEQEAIEQLTLSRKIYLTQDHHLRIQLMKKQMLQAFLPLEGQRTLFKYGAVHMPKGESLLRIYDLGNLINVIADSQMKESVHIMIVGMQGSVGSPFEGFPATPLDPISGDLSFLQPFFKNVSGSDHHVFAMKPLQAAIEKGTLSINDQWLLRTIKGYDFLVIVPTVTPAPFVHK